MIAVQKERVHATDEKLGQRSGMGTAETARGVLCVFMAASTSGFAGAYLERTYKQSASQRNLSIWYLNTQLAYCSLPLAFLTIVLRDGTFPLGSNAFSGFDYVVRLLLLAHAAGGLMVGVVMRYAGNILKCFAVSFSICAVTMLTSFVHPHDSYLQVHQLIGIILVIYSTFLYNSK
jgi:UDP-sugar transporter A1/2/3